MVVDSCLWHHRRRDGYQVCRGHYHPSRRSRSPCLVYQVMRLTRGWYGQCPRDGIGCRKAREDERRQTTVIPPRSLTKYSAHVVASATGINLVSALLAAFATRLRRRFYSTYRRNSTVTNLAPRMRRILTRLRFPAPSTRLIRFPGAPPQRFSTSRRHLQEATRPSFYRTHGRAFFKAFTLSFLTYQIIYWYWLTISAEEQMDEKKGQIEGLRGELRLLEEGRQSHSGRKMQGETSASEDV